jgi:hypothetical protein
VDYLMASPDAGTRQLGSVARLIIDCSAGNHPEASSIAGAFGGQPGPIEADALMAYEKLSEGMMSRTCAGLSTLQMADLLAGMLDRSALPAGNLSIWRLRLKAAKLYLSSGRSDLALHQARLAYEGGTSEAPVPVLIALILLQQGDNNGAEKMLDSAESRMARGDIAGHSIVAQYRAQIKRARL